MLILTLNVGSSSIKTGIYACGDGMEMVPEPALRESCQFDLSGGDGQEDVLTPLWKWVGDKAFDVVGHRVVHGGRKYSAATRLTPRVVTDLQALVAVDPTHMPQALAVIQAAADRWPGTPQVACFDTAFHRHMPRVAQMYPLPRDLESLGVVRYGFHGLSCEYIMHRLGEIDPVEAMGRIVIAHLGNGSSLTAVRGGRSIDTTMGFSPTGGLMMGTRSGDLDPGVVLHLLEADGAEAQIVGRLLNRQSGLLAVSEISADMRELLEEEGKDYRAREAIALYCYQARKYLGALVAVLGGLETLVFTGGIGEHAAEVRASICCDLDFLGIEIDESANGVHREVISVDDSRAKVRVLPTDEDSVIARHAWTVVEGS